jgi:hypothetical protein
VLIEPVALEEVQGAGFYELFIDRRRWPRLMRRGYEATVKALQPFRRRSARDRPQAAKAR